MPLKFHLMTSENTGSSDIPKNISKQIRSILTRWWHDLPERDKPWHLEMEISKWRATAQQKPITSDCQLCIQRVAATHVAALRAITGVHLVAQGVPDQTTRALKGSGHRGARGWPRDRGRYTGKL